MRGGFVIGMAALLVAGCGQAQEDGVGGVTAEEAAALNNAAEMLDTSPDSLAAPEDETLVEESGNDVAENTAQ